MCKIFPSSLGPMAMRWFNGLKANSIDSFKKLTQSFVARFITCNRVSLPLGSLLSMSMQEGETLKTYSDRYWEIFNEIDWLSVLLRPVYQLSMIWENLPPASLLPVYICWWIGLISIGESKRISYREKEKRRRSLRRWRIPGRIRVRIIDLEETLQGSPDQLTIRQLTLCFENQCNRFWRRLRMNRSSDGWIRWQEILWIVTKTFTANIIKIIDILPRIV